MKSFVITAVVGVVALAIQGANAAAIPNADVKLNERQEEHCWEAPDGQVHCSLAKRQEHCWEAPDGQVHCSLAKRQEHCWEAPDGQVHCSFAKRQDLDKRQEHCWEAPDGQVHCSLAKRQEHCWEAPDGQVHCSLAKRQEHCWEAPDGQVHCSLAERQDLNKRQEHCWEAPDGQVHCSLAKRQEHCWEAPDGQIHCSFAKREELLGERDVSAEPGATNTALIPLAHPTNGTTSSASPHTSVFPLVPAVRSTDDRNGTFNPPALPTTASHRTRSTHDIPYHTFASTTAQQNFSLPVATGQPSTECSPVTFIGAGQTYYGIGSAGQTCDTFVVPFASVFHSDVTLTQSTPIATTAADASPSTDLSAFTGDTLRPPPPPTAISTIAAATFSANDCSSSSASTSSVI
ncbi:MAG: hypothetical protein Q9222_002900 [Ikaeria aurantiellina]